MIPIPDILQQVHDLVLTPDAALPLIQQHIDAARSRDTFAGQAMNGMLAAGVRMPDANALAAACFAFADACMAVGAVS